jgi:hypothetical protein
MQKKEGVVVYVNASHTSLLLFRFALYTLGIYFSYLGYISLYIFLGKKDAQILIQFSSCFVSRLKLLITHVTRDVVCFFYTMTMQKERKKEEQAYNNSVIGSAD